MDFEIKLSVRYLTNFILHTGSIDNRFGGENRARKGGLVHRRLQKEGGEHYHAEVTLKNTVEYHNILFTLEGRADGIIDNGTDIIVDEIKTTAMPSNLITEDFNKSHWGQAMCYAYIWSLSNNVSQISVRLTYYQIDTEEIIQFHKEFCFEELKKFYFDLLEKYEKWARWENKWKENRNASIRQLKFPYPKYRNGQRRLISAIYKTIHEKGRVFCQAPTGTGKTMSVLLPALKSIDDGIADKLFYLTAKNVAGNAAFEALYDLEIAGLEAKCLMITSKEKICFLEERDCNPEKCPYAEGYYDRMREAVFDLLQTSKVFTKDVIRNYAKEQLLCPFELALDLSFWCDVIICDYNYLFNPIASLKRFFGEDFGNYIFLIDEAHNLLSRAREMYSARIYRSDVKKLIKSVGKTNNVLYKALKKADATLLTLSKQCDENGILIVKEKLPEIIIDSFIRLTAVCSEWLETNRDSILRKEILKFYFDLCFFLQIGELFDERYAALVTVKRKETEILLSCLDPSSLLDFYMKKGNASILFSATLSPMDYFISVLGGGNDAKKCLLPSPYSQDYLKLIVHTNISTRYKYRDRSILPIANMIGAFIHCKSGNYLVFFPSYQYMEAIRKAFEKMNPDINVIAQTQGMGEYERTKFLEAFQDNDKQMVGFCVLGGMYSEGIDLKGERLIGAVIVGVGLPQINPEQDLIRDYYNNRGLSGFDYAYRFPGMNKVLQAAGRVIRSDTDRGAVLLIDSRYAEPNYLSLFPSHWNHYCKIRGIEDLQRELQMFWENSNSPIDSVVT